MRTDARATVSVVSYASYSGPACSLLVEGPLALPQQGARQGKGPLGLEFCPGRHWDVALSVGYASSGVAIARTDGGRFLRLQLWPGRPGPARPRG